MILPPPWRSVLDMKQMETHLKHKSLKGTDLLLVRFDAGSYVVRPHVLASFDEQVFIKKDADGQWVVRASSVRRAGT